MRRHRSWGGRAGVALALAAAAAVALAHAPSAAALTRAQADRVALAALRPQASRKPVVVFGLGKPLGPRDWVIASDPPASGSDYTTYTRPIQPLGHRAWLYWEDLKPGALFAHPSRLLLVDDRSGRVERTMKLSWLPLVDGRRPAFLRSTRAYLSARYHVFARFAVAPKQQPSTGFRLSLLPALSPDVFKNDCLIMAGNFNEPLVAPNFPTLGGLVSEYGGRVYWATSSGGAPSTEKPPETGERPADGQDLARNVRYLVLHAGCKDVFIYIAGHGSDHGPAAVATGTTVRNVNGKAVLTQLKITALDVEDIVQENPEAKFKLAIDSCFSARFIFTLQDQPNVLVIETSSAATQTSQGFGTYGSDPLARQVNPAMMSWFTNAFVKGFDEYMTSPDELRAEAEGKDVMAQAVQAAHRLGVLDDFAQQAKATNPQEWVNGRTPAKPISIRITDASHTHPPGADASLICAKLTTEPGASVRVSVSGPGPVYPPGGTVTADSSGNVTVTFFIDTPGDYTFFAIATRLSDGAVDYDVRGYTVPPPPPNGAAQGPFPCDPNAVPKE